MRLRRGTILAAVLGAAALGAGVWLLLQWDRSPRPPDVSAMPLREAMAYEASEQYLKLSIKRRQ